MSITEALITVVIHVKIATECTLVILIGGQYHHIHMVLHTQFGLFEIAVLSVTILHTMHTACALW